MIKGREVDVGKLGPESINQEIDVKGEGGFIRVDVNSGQCATRRCRHGTTYAGYTLRTTLWDIL